MLMNEKEWKSALKADTPVFCFWGEEEYSLHKTARQTLQVLTEQQDEVTVLPGPAPTIEEIVMAAGTISFFGTRRVVLMERLRPADYSDKDIKDLCDVLSSLESAVFIITVLLENAKDAGGKRVKKLLEQCGKSGYCAELKKPGPQDLCRMLIARAKEQDTQLDMTTAQVILDRCGSDPFALGNEVDKLAASCGYTQITPALVAELGTRSLEADVWEMVRSMTAKNGGKALEKLRILLEQQNEPLAILGALSGSYIDMCRAGAARTAKRSSEELYKEFHYSGSPYRIKASMDAARRYSTEQLDQCIEILMEADLAIKQTPVDAEVILQTAFCRLAAVRVSR